MDEDEHVAFAVENFLKNLFLVLGIKHRALGILGNHSIPELCP